MTVDEVLDTYATRVDGDLFIDFGGGVCRVDGIGKKAIADNIDFI